MALTPSDFIKATPVGIITRWPWAIIFTTRQAQKKKMGFGKSVIWKDLISMGIWGLKFSKFNKSNKHKTRMKQIIYIGLFIFSLVSCNYIKNKREELTKKAKDQSESLVDKVAPHFDAYTPDTKFNKKRFKDFLQVDITPDVKNIYCFDDAVGIDADYQFSFNCDTSTFRRIIEKHKFTLNKETTDYAFGIQNDFDWWDKKKIEKLDLYSWTDQQQYFKYFWYDAVEQKAYYFDFDL